MWECRNGRELMDLKLLAIRFFRKIWIIAAAAAAGAIFAGTVYFVINIVLAPEPEYETFSSLYVDYVEAPDGKPKYYTFNEAGWAGFVKTDEILKKALQYMSDPIQMEALRECVSASVDADYRVVELTVKNAKPDTAVDIAHAMEKAFMDFAEDQKEIEGIRVMTSAAGAKMVFADIHMYRTIFWGAFISGSLALLIMAFYFCLDDSVYLPETFEKRYGIPMLGAVDDKSLNRMNMADGNINAEEFPGFKEIRVNFAHLRKVSAMAKDQAFGIMGTEQADRHTGILAKVLGIKEIPSILSEPEAIEEAVKYRGILLNIRAGSFNSKRIEKVLNQLDRRGCKVEGAILSHADNSLLSAYYFKSPIQK